MADTSYSTSGQESPDDESGDGDSDTSASDRTKELLEQAHARIKLADEAWNEPRRLALEDLKFRAGDQWDPEVRKKREIERKPCLTINKILQSVNQITNDQRQNRPSLKVHPVDSQADVATAKIIQGLFRHIEYNSNADTAYDTSFEGAVIGGFGYFRVITDYADPMSFDQEILIKQIANPFSVRLDPYSQEPDGRDAMWASVDELLSPEEYRLRYPKSKLASKEGWESVGDSMPEWMPDGSARVTEYFYIEFEEKEIALLTDGQVVLMSEVTDPAMIVDKRTTQIPAVKWCKLNACEILEERDWAGKYIPIIPVYGQVLNIDGKRVLEGIVRHAKDPARMYNFWRTAQTEVIGLAPKAPFVAEESQLEGYEQDWERANTDNFSVLKYKAKAVNGQPLPPPQRQNAEPPVMAITQASAMAADDVKATMGVYDASLGAKSNETSGIAIQRRNTQAQTSNFHFNDNLNRSQRQCGRIVIDLIPHVYDTDRVIRIIGDEDAQEMVRINAQTEHNGKPVIYKLDTGKYDVTLDTGPTFASKRQEAAASMLEIAKTNPAFMQIAPDLMVKNMDWPGAQEIAERFKKMLPPQLQEPDKNAPPIPPQVQQQMQQSQEMIKHLSEALNKAHDERDQKILELESKERIEMAKLETQASIELAKLQSNEAIELLGHQIAELDQRTKMLGFNQPFEEEESQESPQQNLAPPADGATGAAFGEGAPNPTGGVPPGSPMEGNFQ